MKWLLLSALISVFLIASKADLDNNWVNPEIAGQRMLLNWCRDEMNLEQCGREQGLNMTIFDVFEKMATDPFWFTNTTACVNATIVRCLTGCIRQFMASIYGYKFQVCGLRYLIKDERDCWDEDFPEEATRCYLRFYPYHRHVHFYPTPFRVYDENTIARDCFGNEERHCRMYKSHMLYRLMPTYYEIFPHPRGFERRYDYL